MTLEYGPIPYSQNKDEEEFHLRNNKVLLDFLKTKLV